MVERVTAAAVQATPVFLDRDATAAKAARLIGEAAKGGAGLICFPETFIPTYPEWVWRLQPWHGPATDLYGRLLEQSVSIPDATTEALGRAARRAKAYVSMGVNEREANGSTIYNTQVYFGPDGSILGKHRKLMPTGGERLVWGYGDGSTLDVWDTPFGRLGGLICWENYMPLARAALYAKGIDVWVASTWDDDPTWVSTLQHIAKEGRVHVVGVNSVIRASDVPEDVPGHDEVWAKDDEWMSRGRSAIVASGGEIVAGPLVEEEGILYAELDAGRARAQRYAFDPVGHYSRPDVFELIVHEDGRAPVTTSGKGAMDGGRAGLPRAGGGGVRSARSRGR
jgi:nitrilase